MNKQNAKRALFTSALSLLLCVSLLIGTPFAWFTDSVTSAGNIIKSGSLDVEMYWADGTKAPASVAWNDASQCAIFNYALWEPGYTQVRHIKIVNKGTLALKYEVKIVANGEVSNLADVIDVYYHDPAVQITRRTDLTDDARLGNLTTVLGDVPNTACGYLLAENDPHNTGNDDEVVLTLALKMREEAGNEYQGLSIGTDFSVVLLATQYTHEEDSFGDDYDFFAPDPNNGNNAKVLIGRAPYETLQEAVTAAQDGDTLKVMQDLTLASTVRVPQNKEITIDLNGKTVDGSGNTSIAIMSYGDLTIQDTSRGQDGLIKAGSGTNGNVVNICAGTFTLKSGSIYSPNNALLIDEEAAEINILGGSITAEPTTNNSAAFYISSRSNTVVNISAGDIVGYNGLLIWNNTTLNITGGSIDARGGAGIQGNGTYDNTNIKITNNASLTGAKTAIYHPQNGILEISGNAVLTGGTGVVIKGGKISISGGTINGNGAAGEYSPKSSGFVSTGDGLYVEHYDNSTASENYGTPVVSVTGGTFTSVNNQAVASYANPNKNVQALTGFISGGTFSNEVPADLCADGSAVVNNGNGTFSVE